MTPDPNYKRSPILARKEYSDGTMSRFRKDTLRHEHDALLPRTIHAAARALCKAFPHWGGQPADNEYDVGLDTFIIVEAIMEIKHNVSVYMLNKMETLVPFCPDGCFSDSLATFLVNLCMLKADVKSQDQIPTEVLYRMVFRLNRLLHSRGHFETTLVECEHLLARAQEGIALGA